MPPAGSPRRPASPRRLSRAVSFRPPSRCSTAGKNTSADSIEQPTPSVRISPSPARPRSLEIISVPNPIIDVSALTSTPRPMA